MMSKLLVAWGLMAFCVAVHATGVTSVVRWLRKPANVTPRYWAVTWLFVRVAGWIIFLHMIEITAWAIVYAWRDAMPDLTSALYFSAVTYTTTGYGDLVLPPRLAAGRRRRSAHRHPDVRMVDRLFLRDREPHVWDGLNQCSMFNVQCSMFDPRSTFGVKLSPWSI